MEHERFNHTFELQNTLRWCFFNQPVQRSAYNCYVTRARDWLKFDYLWPPPCFGLCNRGRQQVGPSGGMVGTVTPFPVASYMELLCSIIKLPQEMLLLFKKYVISWKVRLYSPSRVQFPLPLPLPLEYLPSPRPTPERNLPGPNACNAGHCLIFLRAKYRPRPSRRASEPCTTIIQSKISSRGFPVGAPVFCCSADARLG